MTTQKHIHEDVLTLDVNGSLMLPDLHITLERILTSMPEECRVIRLDLRQACVEAEQQEVDKFIDYLAANWVPRLERRRGRLIICTHDSPLENGAASLCRALSLLGRRFIGLTLVTTFDEPLSSQSQTDEGQASIPQPGATLFARINLLNDSDNLSSNVRDIPILSEESAVA